MQQPTDTFLALCSYVNYPFWGHFFLQRGYMLTIDAITYNCGLNDNLPLKLLFCRFVISFQLVVPFFLNITFFTSLQNCNIVAFCSKFYFPHLQFSGEFFFNDQFLSLSCVHSAILLMFQILIWHFLVFLLIISKWIPSPTMSIAIQCKTIE